MPEVKRPELSSPAFKVPVKQQSGTQGTFFENPFKYKLQLPATLTQKGLTLQDRLGSKKAEATKVLSNEPLRAEGTVGKAALSLDDYQQPALAVLTSAVIANLKVAFYGPRVTSGSIAAINQLQQLTRIYGATSTKAEDKEILKREAFRAYLGIVFTSFLKGFKGGDYKYNSASAYQGYIEKFVRRLL